MQERNFASRFVTVPLGHKLIALLAAVGIACGGHLWLQRRAVLSASAAELSFDSRSANVIDPGLATIHDPAVVLAQSILTDSFVRQLSSSAPLATTSITRRLGEFRSRLQLSQSSSTTLEVRFLGADNEPSNATANTIAQDIARWTFSRYSAPPESALAPAATAPQPHMTRPSAPVKPAAPQPSPNASALAGALGDLDALLSSTRRDLDNIALSGAGGRRSSDPASRRESDQQHLLKARASAAEHKIDQIRSSPAAKDLSRASAGQLADIQHAVASILSTGNSGAHGFRNVGVSAAEIRRERAQLDDAIATVHRDRLAIQKEISTQGATSSDTAPSTPPAAATTTDLPPQQDSVEAAPQQDSGQAAPSPEAGDFLSNPFTFTRSAAAPTPTPWWPAVVAGIACGLFYWIFAAVPSQESGYELFDTPEPAFTGSNLITPASTPVPREEREASPRITPEPEPVLSVLARKDDDLERRPRRASFRFEPTGPEIVAPAPVAEQPQPPPQELIPAQDLVFAAEPPSVQAVTTPPPPVAADPSPHSEPQPLPEAHFFTPNALARPHEKQEQATDLRGTSIEDIRKRLAEIEIGRRFERSAVAEPSSERDSDGETPPSRSSRLAG